MAFIDGSCSSKKNINLLVVGGCVTVDALTSEESDFVLKRGGGRQPVESMEDRRDALMFSPSHQEIGCTVLDTWNHARDPNEKCVAPGPLAQTKVWTSFCASENDPSLKIYIIHVLENDNNMPVFKENS